MKPTTHRLLLIFITISIVATIGLQLHWNVKNYEENKRRLLNDIQIALDTGVENYYAESVKKEIQFFIVNQPVVKIGMFSKHDSITHPQAARTFTYIAKNKDSARSTVRISTSQPSLIDSLRIRFPSPEQSFKDKNNPKMREFANRIFLSMMSDSINFKRLDSIFSKELNRKDIALDYGLEYSGHGIKTLQFDKSKSAKTFRMPSKSTYLPPEQMITLRFSDPFYLILGRSSAEIILSLLFSLGIVACLLYLLYIINRQKKVEEIRNDLISNITHEFKTPITTVVSAIEGIRNFNENNDKEKTQRYLDISQRQMEKLQAMVEKLLETATLDTDALTLQKEPIDLVILLNGITEKYLVGNDPKIIASVSGQESVVIQADVFHLENAISNIVDNAVKYGGKNIDIRLETKQNQVCIFVEDDGNGIDSRHRERIFEKFYRIPTGNVHDVKGFGIGLYYSRKIIGKHGGNLTLEPSNKTIFKITLPYA